MKFSPELENGTFLRRYKRFLADVSVGAKVMTVHCANTGSMKNCIVEDSPCWLSDSKNAKRKYRYTWEIATTATGHLAGINTHRANALVREALESDVIDELREYSLINTEVTYGNSRFDFLLRKGSSLTEIEDKCFVEVKSVTFGLEGGRGVFPDAKSQRALKHVNELIRVRDAGCRAVLFFCVQHNGIDSVSPADHIDPAYGEALRKANARGVELIAYRASISSSEIVLTSKIPVLL